MSNVYIGEGLLTAFEERQTSTGKRVCTFSILLPEKPPEPGQQRKNGTFIPVESWNITPQLAGLLAKNVKKCRVFFKGHIKQDHWTDQRTGAKRSSLKVVADRVSFIPLNPNKQNFKPEQNKQTYRDNELPF